MKRILVIAIVVAIALYAAVVARLNATTFELDLFFVRLPGVELWMLLFGALLLGAAAAALALSWPYFRLRLLARRQGRRITQLEQEVHGLRTLPLTDEDSTKRASSSEA